MILRLIWIAFSPHHLRTTLWDVPAFGLLKSILGLSKVELRTQFFEVLTEIVQRAIGKLK
jgi:hypothetical protein